MKKLILALASLTAVAGVMAQGTIVFRNASASKVTLVDRITGAASTDLPIGPAAVGQTGYYAQLLYSATETGSYAPCMGTKVGETAEGLVRAGLLASGNGLFSGGDWALTGILPGVETWFKVAAYYATAGTETYADVVGQAADQQVVGLSNAIKISPGGGGTPPATAVKLTDAGLQAWTVAVPEPSVLALGVLGLGAFLLRRRS